LPCSFLIKKEEKWTKLLPFKGGALWGRCF